VTVLVDSGILIEVSRARDATILAKWMELSESESLILFSPATAAELWAGARPVGGIHRLISTETCGLESLQAVRD
jgi:predicted nucleic acid-binding protein